MHHQLYGVGWYRKAISLPTGNRSSSAAAQRSVWLWIGGAPGGVMRSATVWANGVHVGRHVAGRNRHGVQGAHLTPLGLFLNPLGLFLRTSIPFI